MIQVYSIEEYIYIYTGTQSFGRNVFTKKGNEGESLDTPFLSVPLGPEFPHSKIAHTVGITDTEKADGNSPINFLMLLYLYNISGVRLCSYVFLV